MVNGNSEGVGIVNSLSLSRKVISEAENSRGGGRVEEYKPNNHPW